MKIGIFFEKFLKYFLIIFSGLSIGIAVILFFNKNAAYQIVVHINPL